MPIDTVCPFSAPQIKGEFACKLGQEVTRRDGVNVLCQSTDAHRQCCDLYEHLKQVGLPAFDITEASQVPHSVYIKIQYGGLLGLQSLLGNKQQKIDDISMLIERLQACYGTITQVPCRKVQADIVSHKLRHRR